MLFSTVSAKNTLRPRASVPRVAPVLFFFSLAILIYRWTGSKAIGENRCESLRAGTFGQYNVGGTHVDQEARHAVAPPMGEAGLSK